MNDETRQPSESSDNSGGTSSLLEVGRRLYAAREAAHLSQDELAKQLCLGKRQIIALETGDLTALPGKTFVRGFVRNYANAVSLDPKPLLAMLDRVPGLAPPALNFPEPTRATLSPQSQVTQKQNWRTIALGVAVLVVAILVVLFVPENLDFKQLVKPPEEIAALPTEQATPAAEPAPAEEAPTSDANVVPAAPVDTPVPAMPAPVTPVPAPATATPAPVAPVPAPVQTGGNLRFEFQNESWVEIVGQNDQRIHADLHKADSSHELTVTPPVSIIIGRASGVSIYFKGRPVPLHPNSNDVALVKLQ